jgi:hypothetical protein
MTEKEADIILLESLLHTPNSRVDYFRQKCLEGNYPPQVFCLYLLRAYQRIEKYVNTPDYKVYGLDENGNKEFFKQNLYLPNYTDGRMTGNFGAEHLYELLEPLYSFGKSIIEQIEKLMTPPPKEIKRSFNWTGSPEQLDALCEGLKTVKYIDTGITSEAFKMIFADELRPCEPIKWKASNRLLAYLFYQLFEKGKIDNTEWQSVIGRNKLFKNKSGKTILAGDLATALNAIKDPFEGLNPIGSKEIDKILNTLIP